jgi:hypothetical protein
MNEIKPKKIFSTFWITVTVYLLLTTVLPYISTGSMMYLSYMISMPVRIINTILFFPLIAVSSILHIENYMIQPVFIIWILWTVIKLIKYFRLKKNVSLPA